MGQLRLISAQEPPWGIQTIETYQKKVWVLELTWGKQKVTRVTADSKTCKQSFLCHIK